MARVVSIVLLATAIIGGTYAAKNYKFDVDRGPDGSMQRLTVVPLTEAAEQTPSEVGFEPTAPKASRATIRIATFNLGGFDERKLGHRQAQSILIDVISRFDVVAIQDVYTRNHEVLRQLVERINATGKHYDFAAASDGLSSTDRRLSQTARDHEADPCGAFLFDKTSIEIDLATLQTVDDPQDLFLHDPLMALFRTRSLEPSEAFTFKLVNVHTDSARADIEADLLDDLYRAVRDNGEKEDDILLLGTFAPLGDRGGSLANLLDMTMAVAALPTTISKRTASDNIFFDKRATSEFNGRTAVVDLVREFNLTLQGAVEVSEHLPVWAEFDCREGGHLSRTAIAPRTTHQ